MATGGGVAGATEAIAGQSKQDGGPGGPGDGKVVSGSSNKPVNPDGTPAALPVKPDGSPVEPTNPDGSPGTGAPNPDGTPANPDASAPADTNSDGTPAAETSDPEKPKAPAVVAPAAAGGCGCPTCPAGCMPVMCTTPTQKNCVSKEFILKKFHRDVNTEDESDLNCGFFCFFFFFFAFFSLLANKNGLFLLNFWHTPGIFQSTEQNKGFFFWKILL